MKHRVLLAIQAKLKLKILLLFGLYGKIQAINLTGSAEGSARASPSPHHTLDRFTAQPFFALVGTVLKSPQGLCFP